MDGRLAAKPIVAEEPVRHKADLRERVRSLRLPDEVKAPGLFAKPIVWVLALALLVVGTYAAYKVLGEQKPSEPAGAPSGTSSSAGASGSSSAPATPALAAAVCALRCLLRRNRTPVQGIHYPGSSDFDQSESARNADDGSL